MGRLNKIMLIGNAGNDAELRYTPNGDGVASFSLAVGNRYTNREGQQIDETEWFRITSWGRSAEFVSNYIKKGMQVYVEGRLSHSVYQDNAGETKISLEVNARDVQIVQDPPQQQQSNPDQQQQSNPAQQQQSNPDQQQQSNPDQQQQSNPDQQQQSNPDQQQQSNPDQQQQSNPPQQQQSNPDQQQQSNPDQQQQSNPDQQQQSNPDPVNTVEDEEQLPW